MDTVKRLFEIDEVDTMRGALFQALFDDVVQSEYSVWSMHTLPFLNLVYANRSLVSIAALIRLRKIQLDTFLGADSNDNNGNVFVERRVSTRLFICA